MSDSTGWGISISCDECCMQCTSSCDDCVVTFLLRADTDDGAEHEPLVLDLDQVRVVRLLGKAGLVPGLRYQAVSPEPPSAHDGPGAARPVLTSPLR